MSVRTLDNNTALMVMKFFRTFYKDLFWLSPQSIKSLQNENQYEVAFCSVFDVKFGRVANENKYILKSYGVYAESNINNFLLVVKIFRNTRSLSIKSKFNKIMVKLNSRLSQMKVENREAYCKNFYLFCAQNPSNSLPFTTEVN